MRNLRTYPLKVVQLCTKRPWWSRICGKGEYHINALFIPFRLFLYRRLRQLATLYNGSLADLETTRNTNIIIKLISLNILAMLLAREVARNSYLFSQAN